MMFPVLLCFLGPSQTHLWPCGDKACVNKLLELTPDMLLGVPNSWRLRFDAICLFPALVGVLQ